tara:strand:- start:834 stop:1424 length:591 start_codon:yes stop_codon:yes gene_type:complete
MAKPKNPKGKGFLGMKGLISPRAKERGIATADLSTPSLLRQLGMSLNERRARRDDEGEEDLIAENKFDDGSGFGESCVFDEETGQVNCHAYAEEEEGDVSGGGGKNAEKGTKARGLGDVLIAMADRSDKRKKDRSDRLERTARFFEKRSTIGSPYSDFRANMPIMQALARYFDRRSEMVDARRSVKPRSNVTRMRF